jgi:uncharacterized membrane protein YfcA
MRECQLEHISAYFWVCLAALFAGVINAVAGGGTLLTFPALVAALGSSVIANATSTVALVPGSLASAWGYWEELQKCRRWALLLTGPSVLGGWLGAHLLTHLPESVFNAVVPWLILLAAALFIAQPTISRLRSQEGATNRPSLLMLTSLIVFQFLVAVYGGYFGAGIGILMLSSLSLMGMGDIHQMNAVKTYLAVCINGVSVAVFIYDGTVNWTYALLMAIAAIIGGYVGARVARRLNRTLVRWIVIVIALVLAAVFFVRQQQAANQNARTRLQPVNTVLRT